MRKTALLAIMFAAVSFPSFAKTHHHHHHIRQAFAKKNHHRSHVGQTAVSHSHITCDMVRAYVAQVGLVQARAMAENAGMTETEKRQAIQCLGESKT